MGFDQFMLILFDIHNVNVFIFCEGQKISEGNFSMMGFIQNIIGVWIAGGDR